MAGRRSRGPGQDLVPPRGPGAKPLVARAVERLGGEAGDPVGDRHARGVQGCPLAKEGAASGVHRRTEADCGPTELGPPLCGPVDASRPGMMLPNVPGRDSNWLPSVPSGDSSKTTKTSGQFDQDERHHSSSRCRCCLAFDYSATLPFYYCTIPWLTAEGYFSPYCLNRYSARASAIRVFSGMWE